MRKIFFSHRLTVVQRIFRSFLLLFVPLYILFNRLDRCLKTFDKKKLSTPVVSVGNISVGGTGKTAFVISLLRELKKSGFSPAVLKRGQGSGEGVLAVSQKDVSATVFGDEVAVFKSNFPDLPMGVGKNRYRMGRELEKRCRVDLFILDDGFQHYGLARDIEVVLLSSPEEMSSYRLPAGPLRESVASLERADFVSIKANKLDGEDPWRRMGSECNYTRMIHYYRLDKIVKNGHDVTEKLRNEPGILLTTLARPKDLVEFLKAEGINVKKTIQLPDHAGISLEDIPEKAEDSGLLVTEKEYVKLPDKIKENASCIKSDLIIEPLEPLLEAIVKLIDTERKSETDENL